MTPAALVLMLAATMQTPAERALPFGDKGWTLEGDRIAVARDGERDVLEVESGFAHRRDVQLLDGTIDLDVQVTRRRSFVYVNFRVANDSEREEFYLRPHKSALPDAVQYAPVWQDRSAWQLHHGPGGTAAWPFEPGSWTHVRVVVQGRRAAIFVGDMSQPALVAPLAREPQAGSISVGAFLPAGVPGSGPIARFANVVVRPGAASIDLAAAAPAATPPASPAVKPPRSTIVTAWDVSQAFAPPDASGTPVLPAAALTGRFERVAADPSGLVNLDRYVRLPAGARVAAAVARVRVQAARAGTYTFDLGFSDIATVFVNGRAVFRGDASYSFDRPRRDGLIGYDQARLYLPLNAGENEISILLSDTFGGWGLMGRFVEAEGVGIR